MLFVVCSIVPPQFRCMKHSMLAIIKQNPGLLLKSRVFLSVLFLCRRLFCRRCFYRRSFSCRLCRWLLCACFGWGCSRFTLTGRHSPDQAFWPGTDQIFPVCLNESFLYQVIVLGITILDQCTLHSLLVRVCGNIYPIHGSRIQACVVHHRG